MITVTQDDLDRLDPGKWLNAKLIDLRFRIMLSEGADSIWNSCPGLEPSDVYVFSSLFYTKLVEKDRVTHHELVERWTKNVDIFAKKFIFVPIHEGVHWSTCVIINPCLFPVSV